MDIKTAEKSVRADGILAGGSRTAVVFGNFGTVLVLFFQNCFKIAPATLEKYPFNPCSAHLSILVFLLLHSLPPVHVGCGSGRRRGRTA